VTAEVHRLLAIGGSWGALTAMRWLLARVRLPDDVAATLVLHRQAVRSALAAVLDRAGDIPVREADDKTPLQPGTVHVAPPDYHLLVERGWLSLSTDPPVSYSRPSIDVMLESAAAAFGDHVVALVLTGASDDGTRGAQAVRRYGGTVIVQDPATAEQPIMPRAVVEAGAADRIVALEALPQAIAEALPGPTRHEGET
jgi:two-component system chemotaxis response regulator CheB